ncbi:vivid PAS protein VVD [Clohesyomyces aquaticus]|uniref:Vivid PAS protein VVD n=1 Tax=Clohesyomyces aquaticus TaxID=1231657 RepID=A0A1Y1YV24_9PLEO|nr:vivid PAS protein VVD [Clohesyomyces aquaticus]
MEKDVWNPTKYATPKYGVNPFHHGLYSRASGIDVVGILVKVATRKSPQIDLGVIDLSCALVICAADVDDEPVIYVSEGFEMLTGYKSQEIVGRNCRFLQRPPTPPSLSHVEGQGRGDGNTRKRLRLDVEERRETQVQVLNYKKGGEAFVNILSIVPIGEAQGGVKYLVGFMAEAKRWHS